MADIAPDTTYALDAQQNAEIIALARQRNQAPQQLVRAAVAKYLADAEYEAQREVAFAALKHPQRDNAQFGAWRGMETEGVAYQSDLRAE
nr:hypothetical protein [uncultured Duganella sp.]